MPSISILRRSPRDCSASLFRDDCLRLSLFLDILYFESRRRDAGATTRAFIILELFRVISSLHIFHSPSARRPFDGISITISHFLATVMMSAGLCSVTAHPHLLTAAP
jgi:hypothetical protein